MYNEADSFSGTSWGSAWEVLSDSAEFKNSLDLALINNSPAICYAGILGVDRGIYFVQHGNSGESDWFDPELAVASNTIEACVLSQVGSKPAIALGDGAAAKFAVKDGSWGADGIIDPTVGGGDSICACFVQGSAAVAHWDQTGGNINYCDSFGNLDGSLGWNAPVAVSSTGDAWFNHSLITLADGRPALAYIDRGASTLKFLVASGTDGAAFNNMLNLGLDSTLKEETPTAALASGKPFIVYYNSNGQLESQYAQDEQADAWVGHVVDLAAKAQQLISAAEVDGHPACAYQREDGDLMFAVYF